MSQEHEHTSPEAAPNADGIHPEPPPFEPGYQPETLPKISVPDIAADAQGISAEALAQVPTLVDEVNPEALPQPDLATESPVEPPELASDIPSESAADIQDTPVQADTWTQELHVRMGKLTDEIHTLNVRLDQLEATVKIKA